MKLVVVFVFCVVRVLEILLVELLVVKWYSLCNIVCWSFCVDVNVFFLIKKLFFLNIVILDVGKFGLYWINLLLIFIVMGWLVVCVVCIFVSFDEFRIFWVLLMIFDFVIVNFGIDLFIFFLFDNCIFLLLFFVVFVFGDGDVLLLFL